MIQESDGNSSEPEEDAQAVAAGPELPHASGAPTETEGSAETGARTHPLSGLVLGLSWGLGVALALSFRSILDGEWIVIAFTIPAGFVAGVVGGYVKWWFTRYVINECEIRIETGPIFKSSRRIPCARLQSSDINQPLVARVFGLSELTIEMAGGSDSSSKLRFLPFAEARNIRSTVLQRSHELGNANTPQPATPSPEDADCDSSSDSTMSVGDSPLGHEGATLIARLAPDRILIGALLSLDLLMALLGAMLVGLAFVVFDIPIGGLVTLLAFAGGIYSIVSSRVFAQWDFTLSRSAHGLRITRGLFDRSSQSIPFDRIQGIEMVEPLLWRRFGWSQLKIDVAGYGDASEEDGVSVTTLLPISDKSMALTLLNELIHEPHPEEHQALANQASERARIFAPIGWKYRWLTRSADTVRTHTGWVTKRMQVLPHRNVQSIEISQGPWQRRLGVATVEIHTPDGPVSISLAHMNADEAPRLVLDEVALARAAMARPTAGNA
ncbi:MAG: PH domain-containing protein [Actinomycetales bacterium]|nr:PH domain-containing protein [Actinomycetales bacterium]